MGLIAKFSSRKRKAGTPLPLEPVTATNESNHENVNMGSKKGKQCKWHCVQRMRERNCMYVAFAMYTCVKMDATLPTIINNIKLLIYF